MVPIRQPKVALQHPFWGGVSVQPPGAEGTALLLVGQKRLGGARRGRIRLG